MSLIYNGTNLDGGTIIYNGINLDKVIYNGTVVWQSLVMPTKGQIITMNLGNGAKQYRVLKVNGSVAECFAMYDYKTGQPFGSSTTYAGSELDNILNTTFYNSLSSTAKNAIVPKSITQYKYVSRGSFQTATHATSVDFLQRIDSFQVGNRNIYALDVSDIEEYFGGSYASQTYGVYTEEDICRFICNSTTPTNTGFIWLNSNTLHDNWNNGIGAITNTAFWGTFIFIDTPTSKQGVVRPVFQIDLSKIQFS